jgi:hypothetical protein
MIQAILSDAELWVAMLGTLRREVNRMPERYGNRAYVMAWASNSTSHRRFGFNQTHKGKELTSAPPNWT